MTQPVRSATAWTAALTTGLLLLTGCGSAGGIAPTSRPSGSNTSGLASASASPAITTTAEPSTTPTPPAATSAGATSTSAGSAPTPARRNRPTTKKALPPPPVPTAPAPTTAGPLTQRDMPRPAGWQPVVGKGGVEQGYRGNGTWVQGRDPRYAAQDSITIGCAPISRNDYPDPIAALQATYGKRGRPATPGIGLLLQFGSAADASDYYSAYVRQVRACDRPTGPMVATVVGSRLGLIDHRSYPDGSAWTEMVGVHGRRVTQVILTDPGRKIGRAQADAILRQFR